MFDVIKIKCKVCGKSIKANSLHKKLMRNFGNPECDYYSVLYKMPEHKVGLLTRKTCAGSKKVIRRIVMSDPQNLISPFSFVRVHNSRRIRIKKVRYRKRHRRN
jgi:hypothetical protein